MSNETHTVPVSESDSSPHPTVVTPDNEFTGLPVVQTRSGLRIPKMGFGTYELTDNTAAAMVTAAIERGVRHIDTAQMYGNEAAVGRAIAESGLDRHDVFLTTKVDNHNHEPGALVESVERSLELLDTDHVDLLLIHWPVDWDIIGATVDAMAQVHAGGLTRHIGVSNFSVEQLEQVAPMAPFEVLQVECHPFLQQRDLRDWCRDRGWALTAYSPLAQGAVLDDDELVAIADDHDISAAAVALSWLIAKHEIAAIPRTSSVEHLETNLRRQPTF